MPSGRYRRFRRNGLFALGMVALTLGSACGEQTFDLLPGADASTGSAPFASGGADATGGEPTGGEPTGGEDPVSLGGNTPSAGGVAGNGGLAGTGGFEPPPPCGYCEPYQVCDVVFGICVPPCETDEDCSAPRARCEQQSRTCRECLTNADCVYPGRQQCTWGGICVGCLEDTHCADPTPRCHRRLLFCVECVDGPNEDCLPGQYCDLRTSTCVPPAP